MERDLSFSSEYMKLASKYNLNSTELSILIYIENFEFNNYYDFLKDFPIFRLKENTFQKIIRKLTALGLLPKENMSADEVKQALIEKKNYNFICEWCNEKVPVLQLHHYPIPKSKGGTETVKICPNCHYGFHSMVGFK